MSADAKPVISFGPEIRALAEARGLDVTAEEVGQIESSLNSITAFEGNTVKFRIGSEGRYVTLDEAVEIMSVGHGKPAAPKNDALPVVRFGWHPLSGTPKPTKAQVHANATERALAANAAVHEGRSASRLVEAESLVRAHGNPWAPQSISRTRQAVITNLNPALAERLKRQGSNA